MKIIPLVMLLVLTACAPHQTQEPSGSNNAQVLASAQDDEPLNINFCDFLQSPEKYQQKLVRIKAIYCHCFEDSELYSSKCTIHKSVWVQGSFDKCRKAGRVDDFQSPAKDEIDFPRWGGRSVGVVAVGRLIGTKGGYGHMNAFNYLFNIQCLERAELFDLRCKRPSAMTKEQRRKVEAFENSN